MATLEETVQDETTVTFKTDKGETGPIPLADLTEAGDETLVDPDGQTALIDRSAYEREDLAINKVDGQPIDRIKITFSGSVMVDRSEPADVALYNRLVLQREVTLMVEGKCSGTGAKGATDRDGDLDVEVGEKTVKVTTVHIPVVENLKEELARTAEAA